MVTVLIIFLFCFVFNDIKPLKSSKGCECDLSAHWSTSIHKQTAENCPSLEIQLKNSSFSFLGRS